MSAYDRPPRTGRRVIAARVALYAYGFTLLSLLLPAGQRQTVAADGVHLSRCPPALVEVLDMDDDSCTVAARGRSSMVLFGLLVAAPAAIVWVGSPTSASPR